MFFRRGKINLSYFRKDTHHLNVYFLFPPKGYYIREKKAIISRKKKYFTRTREPTKAWLNGTLQAKNLRFVVTKIKRKKINK